MPPARPLPVSSRFSTAEEYVASLLKFSADPLFHTLAGGVHILDFFTRDSPTEPHDLYTSVVPPEWISYFATQSIDKILELLMRTPLDSLPSDAPDSLRTFIREVRDHSLNRNFTRASTSSQTRKSTRPGTERALNAGMKPKKIHEVSNFSAFVDTLTTDLSTPTPISHILDYGSGQAYLSRTLAKKYSHHVIGLEARATNITASRELDRRYDHLAQKKAVDAPTGGSLSYIETHVTSGSISPLLACVPPPQTLLLISLHSCGNLIHHALRAFACTPAVKAVALIGCCYNLMTERSGRTFKTPQLRTPHPRLVETATAADPEGFPISRKFSDEAVAINITARSMACQAPANWTRDSSSGFFKRHFYRALLQRILMDRDIVTPGVSDPVIIGSLRKDAYESFEAYTNAAIKKLGWDIAVSSEEVEGYERRFHARWKDLSILWSLMAFCAGVVESMIVVDRWLFLREMGAKAWVEAVFEFGESPRNLVVVGVREEEGGK